MSGPKTRSQVSESEGLCVVCCKTVEIFSIGECDHPVCYECSTRMRVLCNQTECPICRRKLPKVIFTSEVIPYATLYPKVEHNHQDRKFGLIFCSEQFKKEYHRILENRCSVCSASETARRTTFFTFNQLKDHMRREHNLVYCDLCVENLKIFPFERKCYTRQELGYHRRKGDPDNTSHRGHPLCEYCNERFMDRDELFRHLRRDHLFCHFCDADGKEGYYNLLTELQRHFREEHYLCEEGECRNIPMAAVFRTDIDLKAHIATHHGRYLSKTASKQARTLELEFTLAPRPGGDRDRNKRRQGNDDLVDMEPGGPGGGGGGAGQSLGASDFPALGGGGSMTVQGRPSTTVNFTSKVNPFSGTEFPSLGGSRTPGVTITTNTNARSRKTPEVTITRTLRGGSAQNLTKTTDNFPHLGGTSTGSSTVHLSVNQKSAPQVSIHVSHNGSVTTTHITSSSAPSTSNKQPSVQPPPPPTKQATTSSEAFPALGVASEATPPNLQWAQVKPRKNREESKAVSKVAPAPQLPPSDLRGFPSLSGGGKKSGAKLAEPTWNVKGTTSNGNNKKQKKKKVVTNGNPPSNNNSNNELGSGDVSSSSSSNNARTNDSNNKKDRANNNTESTVKKKSQLNIGSLKSPGDDDDDDDDNNGKSSKAPPGFPAKPPPGFTAQDFPSLSNDLTFTSSSGQSYAIQPSNYHQPSNFTARNQNLIKRASKILSTDSVNEFKSYSSLFRDGTLPPRRYYEYCKETLGDDNFRKLFPELLVLLPDLDKQRQLYHVCEPEIRKHVVLCQNCKQVVFEGELSEHYAYHSLESQFPALDGRKNGGENVWKK